MMTIVAKGDNNPHKPIPKEWEDGQSSWEEFGHNNNPDICGLPLLTVAEWEVGRYWERNTPVLVSGVTDGRAALARHVRVSAWNDDNHEQTLVLAHARASGVSAGLHSSRRDRYVPDRGDGQALGWMGGG